MSNDTPSLPEKYQKLATEYAKLRAQNAVLKKAVIEGKDTQKTAEERIKQREQTIRKYEQELDSLQFRNDQLSKRVGILQDELEQAPANKNKAIKPANTNPFAENVAVEELQMKIEENARLQRELFESNQKHRAIVLDLQEKLESLQKNSSSHQRIIDENNDRFKITLQKLQEEKAMLEARLQKCAEDFKNVSIKSEKSEQEAHVFNKQLAVKYEIASNIVAEKILFNDSSVKEFNRLNIQPHDCKRQIKIQSVVNEALNLLRVFLAGLSDYHTYMEQRIRVLFDEPTDISRKFCEHLHQNAAILRNIEQRFHDFNCQVKKDVPLTLETADGFQEFVDAFHLYAKYLQKLLSYQKLSTEEECSKPSYSKSMEQLSRDMLNAFARFVAVTSELDTYLQLLVSSGRTGRPNTNIRKCFELLDSTANKFHNAIKNLSTSFYSKKTAEHQTPTITQTLKSTDECLAACLTSLVSSSLKISNFLHDNVAFFGARSSLKVRGVASEENAGATVVKEFKERNKEYIKNLTIHSPESIPYEVAIENHQTLRSSTETRDTLTKQASLNVAKIAKLEQDKEHWLLEAQLLQIKYEKENKKVQFLQEELESLHGVATRKPQLESEPGKYKTSGFENEEEFEKPIDLGDLTLLGKAEKPDSLSRESHIKEHYKKRMADITAELQVADSKAVFFHSECENLCKRLQLSLETQNKYKDDLAEAYKKVTQLEDEVSTTKNSYQTQLDAMSDHLCGLSEKLTSQKDEIDALRTGKAKKGKNWFQSLKEKGNPEDNNTE